MFFFWLFYPWTLLSSGTGCNEISTVLTSFSSSRSSGSWKETKIICGAWQCLADEGGLLMQKVALGVAGEG